MKHTRLILFSLLGLIAAAAVVARAAGQAKLSFKADPKLAAHSREFKKEVIKVTDGVYVAVGYGLANSSLIVGPQGRIVIDTMESTDSAKPVLAAFDKISAAPIKAIIYTHFHADHVLGAAVFYKKDKPQIISHFTTPYWMARTMNMLRPIIYRRAMRMFGTMLPPGAVINDGIGPHLAVGHGQATSMLQPTKTFRGKKAMEIAGVKMVLIHAPGETPDQIVVWLPDKKVLFAADNFYKSFPNLYTIRGTAYRDVLKWVASLDLMRSLGAEYLVLQHGRPIIGAKNIAQRLTNYRDAVQFVHDQTVRYINMGLTPDQIVKLVKLPPHLAADPWLQEYYGKVEWSVRSIFTGYLGWYSGRARDLFPLGPRERAVRLAALAGGPAKLVAAAQAALKKKDYQWALMCADDVLVLDPKNQAARAVKVAALTAMAEAQMNANARNYLLTQALEAKGTLVIRPQDPRQLSVEMIHDVPVARFFELLAVNLIPAKCLDADTVVAFVFPDVKKAFTVHVRRGVAEIKPVKPAQADVTATLDSNLFKDILSRRANLIKVMAAGKIKLDGPPMKFLAFFNYFKAD